MKPMRLLVCFALISACRADKDTTEDSPEATSAVLEVYPPLGGQGQSMEVQIDASRSVFEFGSTNVDFGEVIFVESVDVDDGFGVLAQIVIEADAELGYRTVGIDTTNRDFELGDSFGKSFLRALVSLQRRLVLAKP